MNIHRRFNRNLKVLFLLIIIIMVFSTSLIQNFYYCQNPLTSEAYAKQKIKKDYFSLDFENADIKELINLMSEIINKDIIYDDKIRGKITISSGTKIPVSDAFEIFKSILEVKGYTVVDTSSSFIKIISLVTN